MVSVHTPIVLYVSGAFEMSPLLMRTFEIRYELHRKYPEMFPVTFRSLVTESADIVVIPVADANVSAVLPAAEGYPPPLYRI